MELLLTRVFKWAKAVCMFLKGASDLYSTGRFPAEHRIENGGVSHIEAEYPPAQITVFGFGFSWLTWFFLVSGTTMLLMKKCCYPI
jgi:hypothetical protein